MCFMIMTNKPSVLNDIEKLGKFKDRAAKSGTITKLQWSLYYSHVVDYIEVVNDFDSFSFIDTGENKEKQTRDIYILHGVASTGTEANHHPSRKTNFSKETSYLWHNGLILSDEIERLNRKLGTNYSWDTDIIHHILLNNLEMLSDIQGSFACIFFKDSKFYMFRNEIAPLYYDEAGKGEFVVSSIPTYSCKTQVQPNKIILIDLERDRLRNYHSFTTKNSPYDV